MVNFALLVKDYNDVEIKILFEAPYYENIRQFKDYLSLWKNSPYQLYVITAIKFPVTIRIVDD